MRRRILGLETEYALLFLPEDGHHRPTPRRIYGSLSRALEGTHISLEALYRKEGRFLSNSAFIHYEAHAEAFDHGLVEAATPECRTAMDLCTYQRAIDEILTEASREAEKTAILRPWGPGIRDKARPRIREKEQEVRLAILRDLRKKPGEYVEGYQVPKGGE